MGTNASPDFNRLGSIPKIFECLQILDDTNYQTLKYLIRKRCVAFSSFRKSCDASFYSVSKHSAQNMMNTTMLSVVWSGRLFAKASRSKTPTQIAKYHEFLDFLIERYSVIFK